MDLEEEPNTEYITVMKISCTLIKYFDMLYQYHTFRSFSAMFIELNTT